MYDIAILGGGPAGLSAAVQARTRNKSVLIITGDERDGPLPKAERVENYLGMPGMTGKAMLQQFQTHASAHGAEWKRGRALNVMASGDTFYISIGSDVVQAGAVVLAPGVVRGKKYLGERERLGSGVSYCATCDGMLYRGRDVVVVGKTSDAPQEANYLHDLGCRVTYISGRAPEGLHPEIPYIVGSKVEILGEGKVTALRVDGQEIICQGVFILRPAIAPTDLLPSLAVENGYIAVDRLMATSIPGVFAAGDCTGLPLQVSKAVGEGLIAGQCAADYLDKRKEV